MGQPSRVVILSGFDGCHRGHRALVRAARTVAERAAPGVALPVTAVVVDRPEHGRRPLSTVDARCAGLAAWGVEDVVVVDAAHDDPARLGDDLAAVLERLDTAWLVVGCPPPELGPDRWPSPAVLRPRYRGGLVEVPRPVGPDGVPVSSAAVVARLEAGDVAGAAELLGRPWTLSGEVVTGDRRGRTIGFPTANLPTDGTTAVPADGVYAGVVVRADGSRWPAAVNFGRRPTFYEGAAHPLLEAHLLDVQVDLYGEVVTVELVVRLRGEQRFDGLEALKHQLAVDCADARRVITGA
jgi:riboflavin kinase/FMN adenylyltransferase